MLNSAEGFALNHYSNLRPHYNMNVLKEASADLCCDVSFFSRAAAAEVWEETEQGERERSYNNNPAIIRDNVKALMSST